MRLDLQQQRDRLRGTFQAPERFTEEADGSLTGIDHEQEAKPVSGKVRRGNMASLTIGTGRDADRVRMKLLNPDRAALNWFQGRVPDLVFARQ
ncbi:MAG TPA: hypothetical protein VKX25_11710 [Bryobacteraceae bacterium]|nr:hypothetical protein [Bryobacteraceae bacterium]